MTDKKCLSNEMIDAINAKLTESDIHKDMFWAWATRSSGVVVRREIPESNYQRLLAEIARQE